MTEKEKLIELRNKTNDPINHLYYDHAIAQQEEIDKHNESVLRIIKLAEEYLANRPKEVICAVCKNHQNPFPDHEVAEESNPENFQGMFDMSAMSEVHGECFIQYERDKLKAADEPST